MKSHPGSTAYRLTALTVGVLLVVSAVIVLIVAALPSIPGYAYPVVFTIVDALLVAMGWRAARRGAPTTARLWAAWAGALAVLLVLAWFSLLGWSGALTTSLLIGILANVALAAAFRSGAHLAATQVGGIVWAAIAYAYEIPPMGLLVLGGIGLWWIGAIGYSRALVVTTTLSIPVAATLSVHPLTHSGLAVDGADIATLAGFVAVAVLVGGLKTRREPDPRIWPTMRCTAVVALIAQAALGSVPAVADLFAPAAPWPGILVGAALLLGAGAAYAWHRPRPGLLGVIGWAALGWVGVVAAVALPAPLGPLVVPIALVGVLATRLRRTGIGSAPAVGTVAGLAVLVVGIALLVSGGTAATASILAVGGAAVIVAASRPRPVPPTGPTDALDVLA